MLEFSQTPDIDILSLANKAQFDTEYQRLIFTIVGGKELSVSFSVYKPVFQHILVETYITGQLVVIINQRLAIPQIVRKDLLQELHLTHQSGSAMM